MSRADMNRVKPEAEEDPKVLVLSHRLQLRRLPNLNLLIPNPWRRGQRLKKRSRLCLPAGVPPG